MTFGLAAAASLAYIVAIVPPGSGGVLARDGRDRRDQHHRARPARLRRDGDRPRAAPRPRRGDPPVDDRPADRALQPDVLLRGGRARDRPERPVRPRLLPADDGSRRAQADQRPPRPLLRRPGPARRRRGDPVRRPADRHRRPLRRRRVRRAPARDRSDRRVRPRREDPARRSPSCASPIAGVDDPAVDLDRRRQLPRRRPDERRADDHRRHARCTARSGPARTG